MTARDFCYWLQGKLEIDGEPKPLTASQVEVIQRHLSLVFAHDIDPKAGGAKVQSILNDIHGGSVPATNHKGEAVYRC